MKPLRVANLMLLCVLLTVGLTALPASTRTQTAYDCSTATGLPQTECEALVALYNATGGDNWYHKTGWLQTTTPCTWYGVICGAERVTELDLASNNLSGILPPEIGDLTAVKYLDLSNNALNTLPPVIGNLTALNFLYINNNALVNLPPEIGNLTALVQLFLSYNALTALPSEVGNLTALMGLYLNDNALTALPPEIGNLAALQSLFLPNNALTTLPPEIGNLTALVELYMSNNALTALPPEIGELAALQRLDLPHNALTVLPPEIGNLTKLYRLHLGDNALTALPPEIGGLAALQWLDLTSNALTALPPEIGHLTALRIISLEGNALTTLPSEIGDLTTLGWLSLCHNTLTTLPPEIGNLTALKYLYLNDNVFSGAIPDILIGLSALSIFAFYNTDWCVPETGPVPAWLATISVVYGTGLICGQAPGSLRGTVSNPDATPAAGVRVSLYRPIEWSKWGYVTTTHTLADGTYQFGGLGQGIDYRVEFIAPTHVYAPQYYDNQPTLEQSTPVTVTLGMTRTGIDATLSPAVLKSATPAGTVLNGSMLVYRLVLHTDINVTLRLYDPLDSHLTWQGFVGEAPDTLIYADGALTGTVTLSAFAPLTVTFAVQVNVPPESFISEYAQVSNTAYYAFPDETMLLAHPSNTQVNVVYDVVARIFLPLVLRSF